MPYDRLMEEPEEVVDGVPVLREDAPVPATRPSAAPVAVQAAAVAGARVAAGAGGSFVAGAGIVALMKGRRARKSSAFKLGRGRKAQKLEIVGSRSFLVDVHVLDLRRWSATGSRSGPSGRSGWRCTAAGTRRWSGGARCCTG